MKITVETKVHASIEDVWVGWTTPRDIMAWNAATDDWHTTAATVDLRVGGQFSSRMEAKDGSIGFDFAGEYTRIEMPHLIETVFGDRSATVEFIEEDDGVRVRQSFDAESEHPEEMQRQGWQAILDNFAHHMDGK